MVFNAKKDHPILSSRLQQAAFYCSQTAKLGALVGAVSIAASSFFGSSWAYPATLSIFSCCAWAGAQFSNTPIQEILNQRFRTEALSLLPQTVRQFLDNISWKVYPAWKEFMRWKPISNSHTLPKSGIIRSFANIFSPPPMQFVEIRAFTNGSRLKYECVNLQTEAKSSGPIQFDGPIEKMIEILKNCFVSLEESGVPVFSRSYYELSSTDTPHGQADAIVRLLARSDDFIWNIYIHNNIVISTRRNRLSSRCSEATSNYFNEMRAGSLEDRMDLIRECVLHSYNSSSIYLEPLHEQSRFNEKILISKFMWAVTLIRNGGPLENHAEIVIEGINDGFFPQQQVPIGKYFVFFAELLGDKKEQGSQRKVKSIRVKLKSKFNVRYKERAVIWKRPSNLIQQMVRNILQEQAHPSEGFSLFGRHSLLSSNKVVEDSCITWAMLKLATIGIELKQNSYSWLFTDTSRFTKFKPGETEMTLESFLFFWPAQSQLI